MNRSTNDRWLRWTLTAIAALLAVIALQLSAMVGPQIPRASAQIPDSGLQRNQLLAAQQQTNVKLDQILQHLRTQTVKVTLASTDKESKRTAKRPSRTGAR